MKEQPGGKNAPEISSKEGSDFRVSGLRGGPGLLGSDSDLCQGWTKAISSGGELPLAEEANSGGGE